MVPRLRRTILALIFAPTLAWAPLAAQAGELPPPLYDETLLLIDLVRDAADLVAAEGLDAACAEFRQPGTHWFQDEIYLFVLDLEGSAVCHPALPALEGQKLLELRDPLGKPIIQSFLREVGSGSESGWVHYLWPKPGSSTFRWKTAHVRRAAAPDGTDYIVGSGLYEMEMERFFVVEQVEDAVELLAEAGVNEAFYTLRDPATGFRFYDAYVFVMDGDGVMLVNVGFPDLEGRNVAALEDESGKLFVQEMLAVEEGEAAWIDYLWPKPGETRPSRKSSYVRRVEIDGRDYVVGAGVYFR